MEYDEDIHRENMDDHVDENLVINESVNPLHYPDMTFIRRASNENDFQNLQNPPSDLRQNEEKRKPRPFLKRGSGLARYNLPTDLNHLPCRVKRKQPNVKNIQSKYTQETQAFANRKSSIRASSANKEKTPAEAEIDNRPASAATKIFRPRSCKQVKQSKVSPVLKQIMSKRVVEQHQQDTVGKLKLLRRENSGCDSVENSFKEKLSVQSKRNDKEDKELEVFEMLEGATLHSSFSRFNKRLSLIF